MKLDRKARLVALLSTKMGHSTWLRTCNHPFENSEVSFPGKADVLDQMRTDKKTRANEKARSFTQP